MRRRGPAAGAVRPARVVGVLAVRDRVQARARLTTSSSMRVNSSSLQWKQRSGPLARYAATSPSCVSISTSAAPTKRATSWASARSSAARLGDTPRMATTRPGPRVGRRQPAAPRSRRRRRTPRPAGPRRSAGPPARPTHSKVLTSVTGRVAVPASRTPATLTGDAKRPRRGPPQRARRSRGAPAPDIGGWLHPIPTEWPASARIQAKIRVRSALPQESRAQRLGCSLVRRRARGADRG